MRIQEHLKSTLELLHQQQSRPAAPTVAQKLQSSIVAPAVPFGAALSQGGAWASAVSSTFGGVGSAGGGPATLAALAFSKKEAECKHWNKIALG